MRTISYYSDYAETWREFYVSDEVYEVRPGYIHHPTRYLTLSPGARVRRIAQHPTGHARNHIDADCEPGWWCVMRANRPEPEWLDVPIEYLRRVE